MQIIPLDSANTSFGAEITGVDLASLIASSPSSSSKGEVAAESQNDRMFDNTRCLSRRIYQAFLTYGVLVFRNQVGLSTAPDLYLKVASIFGTVSDYPFAKGMPGKYAVITEIIKEPHQTSNFGGMWHSDTTYLEQPPKCTLLYAIETPPSGLGDTLFVDMVRAFETLDDDTKSRLKGRKVVQSSSLNAAILRGDHLASGSMKQKEDEDDTTTTTTAARDTKPSFEALHPAVRTHPETFKEALFVNPSHSAHFEDETREESQPFLDELFQRCLQPSNILRISWEPGTLVVWDNRCLIHCAVNDYNGHRRVMRRITIAGDAPF